MMNKDLPCLNPNLPPKPCHHRWVLFGFSRHFEGDGLTNLFSVLGLAAPVGPSLIPRKNPSRSGKGRFQGAPLTTFERYWSSLPSPGAWGVEPVAFRGMAFFFSTSMDSEIGSTGPGKDGTVMNPTASPLVSFHWLWQWPWSTRQWRKQPDASSPPSRPHEYFHTKFPRVASWKGMIQENKIRRIDSPDIKMSQPEIFFWKEVWQVYMEISKWFGQIRTTNKNVPIQYIWPNHNISPT